MRRSSGSYNLLHHIERRIHLETAVCPVPPAFLTGDQQSGIPQYPVYRGTGMTYAEGSFDLGRTHERIPDTLIKDPFLGIIIDGSTDPVRYGSERIVSLADAPELGVQGIPGLSHEDPFVYVRPGNAVHLCSLPIAVSAIHDRTGDLDPQGHVRQSLLAHRLIVPFGTLMVVAPLAKYFIGSFPAHHRTSCHICYQPLTRSPLPSAFLHLFARFEPTFYNTRVGVLEL